MEPADGARGDFVREVQAFVRAVAEIPELNRIMVHEATAPSDRLRWIVERHTRPRFELLTASARKLGASSAGGPPCACIGE